MQDLVLEETSRRAQASTSHSRVIPTQPIPIPIRKDTLGEPLSEKTLYGDKRDEYLEAQQNSGGAQGIETGIPDGGPKQGESKWPLLKYPIAPQHCRRWGKPESYVISDFSTKPSDGMRG